MVIWLGGMVDLLMRLRFESPRMRIELDVCGKVQSCLVW